MPSMPLIHCVRHAQGFHNLGPENWVLVDPFLTPLGIKQCANLAGNHALESRISKVIASPLTRTIQTAYLVFGHILGSDHCASEILAIPEAQETSAVNSDTGVGPGELKQRCLDNQWPANLSLVHEGWNDKTASKWQPTRDALSKRAKEARQIIWKELEQLENASVQNPEVVLVSHGGFLHYFTNDWEGTGAERAIKEGMSEDFTWDMPGTAWSNAELRTYQITPTADSDYQLLETEESKVRRGKVAAVVP